MIFPSDFVEKLIAGTLSADAEITDAVGTSITSLVTIPDDMSLPAIRFVIEQLNLTGVINANDGISEATGRVRVDAIDKGKSASTIRPIAARQEQVLNAITHSPVTIDETTWYITLNSNSESLPTSLVDGSTIYARKGIVYDIEMYRG